MIPRKIINLLCLGCLILLLLTMSGCCRHGLPRSNTTNKAEDIIRNHYTDEDLNGLFDLETGAFLYDDVRELARAFKIECVRDMREFDSSYVPYIVLLSESGRKLIVYYGCRFNNGGEYGVHNAFFAEDFQDADSFKLELEQTAEEIHLGSSLYHYILFHETGYSTGELHRVYPVAVKEGVFNVYLRKKGDGSFHLEGLEYYPDERLLDSAQESPNGKWLNEIYPLLPVDKE